MANRLAALELVDVEVRHPDPAHLALVDQLGHRRPRLLQRRRAVGVRPVDLVQVDPLDAQATQAGLALGADRLRAQVAIRGAVGPGLPAALGAHEHVLARRTPSQRLPDDLLGVPEAVDRGRVDPVEPFVERPPDRGDRLGVVDGSPAEPPRPADRPGAETEARERGTRAAQRGGRDHRAAQAPIGCQAVLSSVTASRRARASSVAAS